MKIAFLNLCHCDPEIVAKTTEKLTKNENFHMWIHIDKKADITPFHAALKGAQRTFFIEDRQKVYWGGFNAVEATMQLLKEASSSGEDYDYYIVLQNLDYPIKSNKYIEEFFEKHSGKEFIRACNISKTRDWHYSRKYKIFNDRDDDFYISNPPKMKKILRYIQLRLKSLYTIFFNGVIKENSKEYPIYYGTAQWAVTKSCAKYILNFYNTHPKFNEKMRHIQFPDEEYFHTIVHNSDFKYKCIKYNEPEKRWLVNWRNLHYFEYPKEITVFEENDFDKIISQDALFIRKVKTGKSSSLIEKIDLFTDE